MSPRDGELTFRLEGLFSGGIPGPVPWSVTVGCHGRAGVNIRFARESVSIWKAPSRSLAVLVN